MPEFYFYKLTVWYPVAPFGNGSLMWFEVGRLSYSHRKYTTVIIVDGQKSSAGL